MQIADHLAGSVQLDGGRCADIAVNDAAAHDDRRDVDLRMNLGAFANDERVVALDLPLEDAVDAYAPLELERAPELGASSEESRDFGGRKLRVHGCPRGLPDGRGRVMEIPGRLVAGKVGASSAGWRFLVWGLRSPCAPCSTS